ncbi:MAG: DUF5063 domain-containing protein [Nostocoides sp.]
MPDDISIQLGVLADDSATAARTFLDTVKSLAAGDAPDQSLAVGLLALSQILVMGARLGAMEDIVPDERFEADTGPDPDVDALRDSLANLLDGLDEYADVADPLTDPELTTGSISNDLALISAALLHGLGHHEAGRPVEALWWWQFSYLSDWGERAAAALRVLQSLLAHIRLDADPDIVAEAEFDALHP